MKIRMTNKRFAGEATPDEKDVPVWEAAGWVVAPVTPETPKKTRGKKQ